MPPIPYTVKVTDHPGSSRQEIDAEPNWHAGHAHRIGFKNREDRTPGLTHPDDDYDPEIQNARREFASLARDRKSGKLLNFRDVIERQEDIQLKHPENRPLGWRYVLQTTEGFVKDEEEWPANIKRRKLEEEKKKAKEEPEEGEKSNGEGAQGQNSDRDRKQDQSTVQEQEHEHRRKLGQGSKHHEGYAVSSNNDSDDSGYGEGREKAESEDGAGQSDQEKSHDKRLRAKYTAQETALLRALEHERSYIAHLQPSDGTHASPQTHNRTSVTIDEQDQFTPDNWLPRSADLIRLTGKHPLNAEPVLMHLFDAGLVTPNELHYVRNHGAVPRLIWELHTLKVSREGADADTGTSLSMQQLQDSFAHINVAVALACDGNRRKELNLLRKSKGFSWGAGAVGCAYWKGPLLRDVLVAAPGVLPTPEERTGRRFWVHFAGADEPSEGRYETCIPLEYALDETNDVLLALEMNNRPLPPDHGYPVRVIIPGYVGGRCVKWLQKVWVSERENDSHYHVWDNRVLPSFVTEKDGEFAEALFRHPDTACYEQNLNSVIVRPAQGERISLARVRRGHVYRIRGYAYDGGGHAVQRVEVSLDGGATWLYCIRKFPERPVRHGNKFWTWVQWHVDVELAHLLRAESISVRCFNVFKNTQPREPVWNIMGMMNNCWYVVRPEMVAGGGGGDGAGEADGNDDGDDGPSILFRHPTEPGTVEGGWMKPSEEVRISQARQEAGTPQKMFTRQEIEKHDSEKDCWLVVDGKVYDATSVLEWHPGGKSAIIIIPAIISIVTAARSRGRNNLYWALSNEDSQVKRKKEKERTSLTLREEGHSHRHGK